MNTRHIAWRMRMGLRRRSLVIAYFDSSTSGRQSKLEWWESNNQEVAIPNVSLKPFVRNKRAQNENLAPNANARDPNVLAFQ